MCCYIIHLVIIDCHTHRYPEEVIRDPVSFAKSLNEDHWLSLVKPEKGKSLQGWAPGMTMIEDMQQAGINKSVLLGWYWENPDTCILQNNWCAKWILENPNKFSGFVSLHPKTPNPLDELKKTRSRISRNWRMPSMGTGGIPKKYKLDQMHAICF